MSEPSYLLVTWVQFARRGKHYAKLIEDGQYIAITKSSRIVATLHPYRGEDISVYQGVTPSE